MSSFKDINFNRSKKNGYPGVLIKPSSANGGFAPKINDPKFSE